VYTLIGHETGSDLWVRAFLMHPDNSLCQGNLQLRAGNESPTIAKRIFQKFRFLRIQKKSLHFAKTCQYKTATHIIHYRQQINNQEYTRDAKLTRPFRTARR